MNKINYIIKNSYLADVKDKQWKDISVYMKFGNGIDLSARGVNNKRAYIYYTNKDTMKGDENPDNNFNYNPLKQPFFNSAENQNGLFKLLIKLIKFDNNFRILSN